MKSSHVFAFIGGAAVGAIAALLFAPAKGDDTRRMMKDYIDKEKQKVKDAIGRGCDKLEEKLDM